MNEYKYHFQLKNLWKTKYYFLLIFIEFLFKFDLFLSLNPNTSSFDTLMTTFCAVFIFFFPFFLVFLKMQLNAVVPTKSKKIQSETKNLWQNFTHTATRLSFVAFCGTATSALVSFVRKLPSVFNILCKNQKIN